MTEAEYLRRLMAAIREAMQRRNLSFRDAADATGIPASTLSGWLTDEARPRLYQAVKACEALGIAVPGIGGGA